jgi:hypothetical protein
MIRYYLAGIALVVLGIIRLFVFFQASHPASFLDARTQLIWQLCSAGMRDNKGVCVGPSGLYDWQQALQYCSQLDGEDWHLPSREELITLIDWQKRTPAVPDTLRANTKNNIYWTATTSHDEPYKAYYVSMFSGYSYPNKKILQVLVRCVRRSG